MLNFDFLENDLVTVSPLHFMYDFSRKVLLMLYSISCYFPTDQISLSDCLSF